MPAPIAVFAFNRPGHLAATLAALADDELAKVSEVTVFCDGERRGDDREPCQRVREVAHAAGGFGRLAVVEREANLGCAGSVISGTAEMFRGHERLIVIEDDVLVRRGALGYLNTALDRYAGSPAVFSVAAWSPPPSLLRVPLAYPYDAYFVRRFHCWGWASWRDRWTHNDWTVPGYDAYRRDASQRAAHAEGGADLPGMLDAQIEGRIDSWAIRAEYTRFRMGGLTLYPRSSFVRNIGFDGSGRHCGAHDRFGAASAVEAASVTLRLPPAAYVDPGIARGFRRVYSQGRIVGRLRRLLGRG